jgi:hypothetical protein
MFPNRAPEPATGDIATDYLVLVYAGVDGAPGLS